MTRALIFGTGAVGSVYGYILQKGGSHVTCICRSNYKAAKEQGFTFNSKIWGDDLHFQPNEISATVPSVSTPENAFDYIIVTAKALPGTIPDIIKPAVTAGTSIVLLQNGIGVEDEYREAFPYTTIITSVVYLPVTQTSPAIIAHQALERLEMGSFPPSTDAHVKTAVEQFAELIRKGGATATIYDDVQGKRWSKLMVNASWNGLCALSRSSDVAFLKADADAWKVVRDIMAEVRQVGLAAGYGKELSEEDFNYQLERFRDKAANGGYANEPSMLADVRLSRLIEVDAIFGNCLRLATTHNLECPRLQMMYVLAKALDKSLAQEPAAA